MRSVFAAMSTGLLILALGPEAMAGPPSGADLSVTIDDSPDPVYAGAEVTYSVSVTNAGPGSASDVWVNTDTGEGATFVRGTSSQGTCFGAKDSVDCSLGSLAKRGSATLTLVFRAGTSDVTATAWVVSSQPDSKVGNNEAITTTSVVADPTPRTLATCGNVAPLGCRTTFQLPYQKSVRVTLQPSPQFTGTLVAYLDGVWPAAAAGYTAGKLDWGTPEGFVTLYPGEHELVVTAPNKLVRDGGPITVGIPVLGCFQLLGPNHFCPPGPWTVNAPPVTTPSVGSYQVTAFG